MELSQTQCSCGLRRFCGADSVPAVGHKQSPANDRFRDACRGRQALLTDGAPLVAPLNLGFAGGHNVAIREALAQAADFVWLLNSDAIAPPHSLAQPLRLMD